MVGGGCPPWGSEQGGQGKRKPSGAITIYPCVLTPFHPRRDTGEAERGWSVSAEQNDDWLKKNYTSGPALKR